jgi:hypothetical protein
LFAAPFLAVPTTPGFHAFVDLQKIGTETVYGKQGKKVSAHDQNRGSSEHDDGLERHGVGEDEELHDSIPKNSKRQKKTFFFNFSSIPLLDSSELFETLIWQ